MDARVTTPYGGGFDAWSQLQRERVERALSAWVAADAPAGTEAYRAPVAHQLQHHPLRQLHRGPGPGLAGFARDWGAVVKAGLATLLLATVLTGAGALAAPKPDSDQTVLATKAAMDAFFSMEGSTPEGVSNSSAPDGFQGGGEAELIAYLSEQRGHGARWDRYRYLGTLLHHSLRAGFDDVARWLLRNGADPTQRIDAGGLDALGEGRSCRATVGWRDNPGA